MTGPSTGALHAAYRLLLQRAAESGWIEPGGLTPREQCAALASHEGIPPAHRAGWERLERLLDVCVYAGRGTEAEAQELLALIAVRSAFLVGPPPRATAGVARRKQKVGSRRSVPWGLLAVAAAAVAAVALAPALLRGLPGALSDAGSIGAGTTGSSSWATSLNVERDSLAEYEQNWHAPRSSPTWRDLHPDPVMHGDRKGDGMGVDLNTGRDGTVIGVPDPCQPPLHWRHRLRVSTGIDAEYRQFSAPPGFEPAYDPEAKGPWRSSVAVPVDFVAGQAIAIPSTAPDAVVTSYRCDRGGQLTFTRDRGDVLRVTGTQSGRGELRYDLVAFADYENAALPDTPFEPVKTTLPSNVRKDAKYVLDRVGGVPGATYRSTVRRLHAYCSGFVAAPITEQDRQRNPFLTLALARKGVCYHRAFVFFVLANAAGVKTRMVENQAHAFCEVQLPDGAWRRIEFRLETWAGDPGAEPAAGLPDPGLLPRIARGSTFGLVLAALGVIALLGLLADANRHRLPRTAIPASHAVRAHRDAPLLTARALQESARMLSEEVRAGGEELPAGVAMRGKSLSDFGAARAPEVDAGTLQHLKWDFISVLRWLRGKKGDERR